MSEEREDYLGRGLGSVMRRLRARGEALGSAPTSDEHAQPEPMPDELASRPVLDLIARGGVGLIYRVHDRALGRELAVKVLSRRYADDAAMVSRFEAEASICAQLQHPGVVPIHEVGRLADGRPYFTMKVVEGDTLLALLNAREDVAAGRRPVLDVFQKVCQTMAYVHAQGVLHLDLKPSNVMVGAFGEVQVMDWGFARRLEPETSRHTSKPEAGQQAFGTPAYMAPEQARGDERAIGTRTDVFGLGAILCEVLCGRPPYTGDTRSATFLGAAQAWQQDAHDALTACGAEPALVDLATRCLAPDPRDRPRDAAAVADELATWSEGVESRARALEHKAIAAEARASHERRTRRIVLALASALVLAVVAVAAVLLRAEHERSARRAAASRELVGLLARGRAYADRARIGSIDAPGRDHLVYWNEAQASLQQAVELATERGLTEGERDGAEQQLAEVRAEAARAARSAQLVAWVERMRPHYSDDRESLELSRQYRAGFARFGFQFAEDPAATAQQLRASPVGDVLCMAVDDWARVQRSVATLHGSADVDWRRLVDIALAADPHAFRDRLREAFRDDRRDDLLALADSAELRDESPATVDLLAKCLFDVGAAPQAIAVLRAGAARHPDDYWILHDLAVFLRRSPDAAAEEIVGLCRAAVAVRPGDPHALADFAHALAFHQDRWREAGEVVDRVLAHDAAYVRPWFAEVLLLHGEPERALECARTVVEREPDDVTARRVHGWTASIQGRPDEALATLEVACRNAPDDVGARIDLLHARWAVDDLDGATETLRTIRELFAATAAPPPWSAFDELLAQALEHRAARGRSPSTAHDGARAVARFLDGNAAAAATAFAAWLEREPDAGYAHWLLAARIALAAANDADTAAASRWQQQAVEHLERAATAAAADPRERTAAPRRRELSALRWVWHDPTTRATAWRDDVHERHAALRSELRRRIDALLAR